MHAHTRSLLSCCVYACADAISAEVLGKMKPTTHILNMARGEIVDGDALQEHSIDGRTCVQACLQACLCERVYVCVCVLVCVCVCVRVRVCVW